MKKRLLALTLAALSVTGLLSGCGSKESQKGFTTVTMWSGDSSASQTYTEIVEKFNDTIGKEKKIKVELTMGGSDYYQTVDVAQQNDQLPDILDCTYNQVRLFVKNGDLVPLESFKGHEEIIERIEKNGVAVDNLNTFDGKHYNYNRFTLTAGLIYNKDLFKEAGIVDKDGNATPPKTWEELREYAKKLTNEKKGIYGYSFPYKASPYYNLSAPFASSFVYGRDYDNLEMDYSEYADVFNLMLQLRKDGSLFPGSETLEDDTSRAYFAEGQIAMAPSVSWDVAVYTSQFVTKCDWGIAPMPVKDPDNVYPMWSDVSGGMYLSKNALKNSEAVFEFYKYFYSDKVSEKLVKEAGKIMVDTEYMNSIEGVDKYTKAYAELYDPDYDRTIYPSFSVEGTNANDTFRKVWTGEMSLKDAVEYVNKNQTEGLRKAVKDGTIDVTPFKTKK